MVSGGSGQFELENKEQMLFVEAIMQSLWSALGKFPHSCKVVESACLLGVVVWGEIKTAARSVLYLQQWQKAAPWEGL